jgi:hypothetical protein
MLSAPTLLSAEHPLDGFTFDVTSLDDSLKRRARTILVSGPPRTYVVDEAKQVVYYYCLASGALASSDAPAGIKRNMPDPLPMAIL